MWFGKNIITKVGLALAMAVPALAADVAPLYFENVPADSQQAYWDNLTKYKIWGTTGISVGNEVMLPDESGWIGSATGGITTTGGRQKLGGPIILGGGISLQDGTQFTTGPVRATENFTAGNDNQGHFFAGTICLGGTADNQVKIGINRANNGSLSTLHEGADALTGACAADSVPLTPTKMTIPVVSGSHSYTGDIHVSGTRYIDIPPESETDKGMKDLYLNSLSIANDGKLYIRMPAGGRLTRIFLQTLSFATHPTIQVMYMDESATFTDGEWSGTGTIIANQAYAGNLLFYVPHDIKFENTDNVPVQGTFISTGTITLLCNMKFAGQMLAENMVLGNQIDGSSFIYVPFDPPVIDLADPEARSWGTIYEGIIGPQTLSVSLSKVPTTDVSFKYCFTATGDPANNKDMEENETSTKASESDIDVSNIPICNADGENSTVFETIHFVRGRSIPEESIAITVVNDKIEEWTERFNIRIFGLLGAVLPDNMRSGEFFVDIVDDDKAPQGKDTTFVAVEDADFVFEKFPATTGSGTPLAVYSVKIETMPTKGTLTYFGEALVEGQVIPFDSLGNLIFRALPDDHGADYDSLTYKILNEDDVVAINSSWLKFDVAAVNDAPTVVSDTLKIKENSAAGEIVEGPFTVNDVDDSKFTYAFKSTDPNYDAVNALYTIGADNAGALQIKVKSGAKLDYESADSILTVTVIVTDMASSTNGEGKKSVESEVVIKILDDNEKPKLEDVVFFIDENSTVGDSVGLVKAKDEDIWTEFTYSLLDSTEGVTEIFEINPTTGKITVKKDDALNYEKDSVYYVKVVATDNGEKRGFTNLSDTATVTIKLNDINEDPKFEKVDDEYNIVESTKENPIDSGFVFGKALVFDPDAKDVGALKVTLTDKNKKTGVTSAEDLFDVTVIKHPNADSAKVGYALVVISVKDSAKLDYEALYNASANGVLFDVTLTLTDESGVSVPVDTKIRVDDSNEAPDIQDATFAIKENAPADTLVGALKVTDPDDYTEYFRELVYTIVDENVPFKLDSNKILVNGALNHEDKTTYTFRVAVTDAHEDALTDTATVTITIENENENPDLKCLDDDDNCLGPYKIEENSPTGTTIHKFAVSDVDAGDVVTLAIVDTNGRGADTLFGVKFNDDLTQMEVFVLDSAKLDYENLDPSYVVRLIVTDQGLLADTLVRVINVIDVNEAPSIDDATFSIAENAKVNDEVGKVSAKDPDTKTPAYRELVYTIVDKNVPFRMDSNVVKVNGELNHEVTTTYTFKVAVTDKNDPKLTDTATVTVTIDNVNEQPDIKCVEGDNDCNGPFRIAENSKTGTPIHTFAISDVDAVDQGKLTVTLTDKNGKNAAELFDVSLNSAKTEVTVVVKDSAKLDYEAVDSIYTVVLTVIDLDSLTDTLVRVIKVIDVNEKPSIEKVEKEIAENLPNGTVVAEMKASDPDTIHKVEFAQLTYEITTPNMPFGMNGNKVVVTDSSKLDFETNPKFEFYVKVKNCEYNSKGKLVAGAACLEDSAKVVLTLKDMNEKPDIKCIEGDNDCNGPFSIAENSKTGTPIHAFAITDVDAADQGKLTVTITDKNGKNAAELFDVSLNAAKTEVTVVVKDSAKLDYESVDSIYTVILTVIDRDSLTDTLVRVIKVVDVNEKPTVKDIEKDVDENLKNGTVVAEVEARDPDTIHKTEFAQLTYAITTPDMPFDMNGNKVVVTDSSKLDFETNPKFEFYVKVTNCEYDSKGKLVAGAACLEDSAKVIINLNDVNERPKIIIDDPDDDDDDDDSDSLCVAHCDTTNRGNGDHGKDVLTVGVNENSPKGKVVFEYVVYDEDAGDMESLKPFIEQFSSNVSGKKAEDLFEITKKKVGKNSQGKDKWKIIVSVKDSLNYETLRNATSNTDPNPQFTVRVIVSDQSGNGVELRDTILRVIEVHDVNESPLFDVWPCEIAENNEIGDSIGKIEHPSDIDSMARPENVDFYDNQFKLVGGDTALFDLEYGGPLNIKLVAKVKFDCESEPYKDRCGVKDAFNVVLDYYDKQDTSIKMTKTVPITLIDVNELPEIKTEVIEVVENAKKGTVVDTIKAEDVDVYDTVLTYTLAEDNSKCFDIGKNSGIVTVKTDKCASLDYEKNTELPIKVKVTDTKGGSVSKVIRVKIKDVNEAPNLDNKTITVKEDTPVGTVVDKVVATDPDKAPEYSDLTYKVIGGDTTMFSIDPKTGEVTLKDTLDYELKAHSYKLIVQVDDHEYPDIATLTINIKNVEEWSDVVITKYDNIDSTWNYPDTIYTNQPEGTITWKQDGEIMSVDTTLKKGKNVIVITYKDPTKDYPGKDTIVVMFNDDTPVVTVSAKAVDVKAENVYTIVERTDLAAEDTNIYVNKLKDSIYVTVKDKASKRDTAFAVEISLEPVVVPQTTLNKVSDIAKNTRPVNDIKLSNEATRISLNGDEIKLTYNEVYGKDTVTVSYVTDKKGEPVKVPVVNAKGKIDSLEIITISYKTVINGEEVTISYQAEANTGEVLAKGPSGELMVQGASKKSSSKDGKESSSSSSDVVGKMASEGIFTVVSEKADTLGNSTVVSYAIDEKGVMVKNEEGDIGYAVTYTYVNMYGNAASQSVFIVLDQVGPKVEIITPANGSVVRSNYVTVEWTVNGIKQDTLTLQGLEKGANVIVRFFRDKAGNEASDTVFVVMKDSKDVDLAVEEPVTEITKEKVEEYYAINPPEEGQTFAVSVRNPTTGEEKETLIGGKFETKDGSGKEPYPGVKGSKHLGPTLTMDVKLPVINAVGGLATMDDLVSSDGMIPLEGVDAENATKVTVEQYVEDYCEDGFKLNGDLSQVNMYRSKMHVQIWIYTSLGNFVDYYAFTQDLNDPSYTNEAGLLEMYFEMKPDKDGFVKADNGKLYATGSYLYKVEASIRSELRCTLPPVADPTGKKMGDKVKSGDELLKSFGYKRPPNK